LKGARSGLKAATKSARRALHAKKKRKKKKNPPSVDFMSESRLVSSRREVLDKSREGERFTLAAEMRLRVAARAVSTLFLARARAEIRVESCRKVGPARARHARD